MLCVVVEWVWWAASVVAAVVGGWAAWWVLLRPSPPPAHVTRPYATPSLFYPLKVVVFYCLVKFRGRTAGSAEGAGYGSKSYSSHDLMERPQPLHPGPKAIDAVFFSGAAGGWGVILAMERRPNRLTAALVYLKVPGMGLLVSPSHPDTVHFQAEGDEDRFRAGGVTIAPVTPMTKWRVQYSGSLRPYDKPAAAVMEAKMDLEWVSDLPHFDYDSDMDALTTARAFALEPWSKEYFQDLRDHHQTHYEQLGHLQGTVTLDGATHQLRLPAFRDHSYGKRREWKLMHRYVFHHIFLQDGSKGVVGVVCQPSTCSRLMLGNWWWSYGKGGVVTSVDLDLRSHGEGGTPPQDYAFTFTAGGEEFLVEVEVEVSPEHYLGWDWEARMVETWVKYRVNGVAGEGVCEWNYRHTGGRPADLTAADPKWTSAYRQQYLEA